MDSGNKEYASVKVCLGVFTACLLMFAANAVFYPQKLYTNLFYVMALVFVGMPLTNGVPVKQLKWVAPMAFAQAAIPSIYARETRILIPIGACQIFLLICGYLIQRFRS